MDKVQRFWSEFCILNNKKGIEYKAAFQFGASADRLASLVVEGKKTATTSGFEFYELENEAMPQAGEYYIILNSKEDPVAVIRIESVEVVPMNEVTEDFALAEGEGDYHFWWDAHEKFFTKLLKDYNKEFSANMLVVCERFKIIYSENI